MSDSPSAAVPEPSAPEVVVTRRRSSAADGAETATRTPPGSEIESPAKIIRIGAMVKQLLEEVRNTSIDDATRDQLRRIYGNSVERAEVGAVAGARRGARQPLVRLLR